MSLLQSLAPDLPIGPDNPWLAPLAGFSDLPFRLLCRELGCAVACTEMISAKGLMYKSPGTTDLLRTCPEDTPLVVQLFGSEPEVIADSLSWLVEQGYTYFDLNAGCPVRKVVKTGAGAGLLRDWDNLLRILSAMVQGAGPGRVGVKLRAGWGSKQDVLGRIRDLDALDLGWVSVHPRTVPQGYAGRADWEVLSAAGRELDTPVLASGDLFTAGDGVRCIQETGVRGLMFARGALADPRIFATYLQIMRGDQDGAQGSHGGKQRALSMARRHIELIRIYGKGSRELLRMRTIIPRYLRGFQGVKNIRKRVVACTSWSELMDCLDEVEAGSAHEEGS
ncbi:MAG: tRNA-dihydrouridine synthase family protein [Desulfovermiculus sp.]